MIIFGKSFAVTGLVFAGIFLTLAIAIFVLSRDAHGEGAVIQLIITFPWFFLSLSGKIPLWIGIIPNTIVFYYVGKLLEFIVKKIFF